MKMGGSFVNAESLADRSFDKVEGCGDVEDPPLLFFFLDETVL